MTVTKTEIQKLEQLLSAAGAESISMQSGESVNCSACFNSCTGSCGYNCTSACRSTAN